MPGGGITGATVATVGGAIIVAGAIAGRTTPGSAITEIIVKMKNCFLFFTIWVQYRYKNYEFTNFDSGLVVRQLQV